MPITVTAPRIVRTTVICFEYCVEDIVMFYDVATEATVTYVDACTRHFINTVMAKRYVFRHVQVNTGCLLISHTYLSNEVVLGGRLRGVGCSFRAGGLLDLVEAQAFPVLENGGVHRRRATDEADCRSADILEEVTTHTNVPVVAADEDCIAPQIAEIGICDCHPLCALDHDGTRTANRPVRAEHRFRRLHHGACSMGKGQAFDLDIMHGIGLGGIDYD